MRNYGHDGEGLSFAILSFGNTQVMFNQGGRPSTQRRREVDLYVYTDNVDEVYQRLKDRVEIVEGLHDTFYGMRELIIRDLNRFWITFGQTSTFGMLINGVEEGNTDAVRTALQVATDKGGLKPERLTAALVAASHNKESGESRYAEIRDMLKQAGAVMPPELDHATQLAHVGKYKSDQGMEADILLQDGKLFAVPAGESRISLITVDKTTFRHPAFDGVTISFSVEAGRTMGFVLKQGDHTVQFKRAEETKQA